ncbi:MAG: hypothetical protein KJ042_11060, partial [Deltaproteobacteria bacterium]|nr:hypothetical protein [Deltaproteobacteria bacterium]
MTCLIMWHTAPSRASRARRIRTRQPRMDNRDVFWKTPVRPGGRSMRIPSAVRLIVVAVALAFVATSAGSSDKKVGPDCTYKGF